MINRQWMLEYQNKRDNEDKIWREKQEQKHSTQEWLRYALMGIFTLASGAVGALLTWFFTRTPAK